MFEFIGNNFLQHLGYLFTFLALSIKDVLWLRVTLAIAQIVLGIYQISIQRYDVVIWNSVFTIVNFYHIIRIIQDRKPIYVPEELQDIYKNIFKDFSSKEFMNFIALGESKNSNEEQLIKEGMIQKNLYLILDGSVNVQRENKHLSTLGRGKFIAEMSLITNEPASADIFSNKSLKYIAWNQDELRHLQKSNKELWIKLHNILSKDLINKIKNQIS